MKALSWVVIFMFLALLAIGSVRAQLNSTDDVQQQFQDTIGKWLNFFQTNINWLSTAFLDFLKNVLKAIYFTLGVIGFVMWSTGISKYSGRRLLIGAIALALMSQIFL